jgi:hypothetical protein
MPQYIGNAMIHAFEIKDSCHHGQHRFNEHTIVPDAAQTGAQVGRMPIVLGEMDIPDDDQPSAS